MKIFLALIFISWVSENHCEKKTSSLKLSYEDLNELNASCYPRDSCLAKREYDPPGIYTPEYSCSCDEKCYELDTCCIDSPYRAIEPPMGKQICRTAEETFTSQAFYMVHTCPNRGNSIWKNLCEDEWNREDNTMKIAPVTSLITSTTYKNYYCFRCHETTDEFVYWNPLLENDGYSNRGIKEKDIIVSYNRRYETWMATVPGKGGVSIPVKLQFLIPDEIRSSPISCDPLLISRCSDTWVDQSTAEKCNAYTAIIYITRDNSPYYKYKNAHCAICNFESLDNMICEYLVAHGFAGKIPFSFTQLLDINRSDGDRVGKTKQCKDNYLWDPFAKKCREISCALPGYIIKDGQCTPP